MARCFQESHEAYAAGNGAKAKELSNEGRQHQAEMNRLNQEASNWIFQGLDPLESAICLWLMTSLATANNQDSAGDELDLHGLYVKEAIARTDRAIVDAQTRGDDHIRVIVGKVNRFHETSIAAQSAPRDYIRRATSRRSNLLSRS